MQAEVLDVVVFYKIYYWKGGGIQCGGSNIRPNGKQDSMQQPTHGISMEASLQRRIGAQINCTLTVFTRKKTHSGKSPQIQGKDE